MKNFYLTVWRTQISSIVLASKLLSAGGVRPPRFVFTLSVLALVSLIMAAIPEDGLASVINNDSGSRCGRGDGFAVGRSPITGSAEITDGNGYFSTVAGCGASAGNQLASTAFGAFSKATGSSGSSAFGFNAQATGKWSTVMGLDALASGISSTGLGFGVLSTSVNTVAIGGSSGDLNGTTILTAENATTASADGAVAIGSNIRRGAQALATDAIAVGGEALVAPHASSGVSIGSGSVVTTPNSVAIGANAAATGKTLTIAAYGVGGTATGEVNIANGANGRRLTGLAPGSGPNDAASVAQIDQVGQNNANALGGGAELDSATGTWTAPSFNTTTIDATGKASATPTTSNTVGDALTNLSNSLVNTAAVGVKYDDANTKTKVTFNQGGLSTTLSNIAAGSLSPTSTEAVNGSQLNTTNTAVAAQGNQLNTLVTNVGTQNQNVIKALGGGAELDSATGTWTAPSFNTTAIDATGKASATPTTSNTVGDALTNLSNSLVNTAAVGVKYDDANTKTKVTFNQGGLSTTLSNIAAGSLSPTSTEAVNGSQLNATNTAVAAQGNQLNTLVANVGTQNQNVIKALGGGAELDSVTGTWTAPSFNTTAIDATGKASATPTTSNTVGDALTNLSNSLVNTAAVGVKYDDANTKTKVTFNQGGLSTTLSNIAAGSLSPASTEAVNGGQLNATNTQLNNIINRGAGIKYFHVKSTRADSVVSGTNAMALGPNAQAGATAAIALGNDASATGVSAVAIGDGATATADGSVALGRAASADQRNTKNYAGKYSSQNNSPVGVVSVGNAAMGQTRILSNVADASEATDAVNLRQLDGAVAESKAYTSTSVAQVKGDISNMLKGTSGAFQVNNSRNAQPPKVSGANAVAGGMGSQASGDNGMAVGSNAQANAENATATGNDAQAVAKNSVALGANSIADRENSVSVGSVGSERQITSVAAGSRMTDAVNVEQLSRSVTNITSEANAYTDRRFADIRQDLKRQDNTLSAGIAGAMAMASLPRPSVPGGSMTSVAMGNYRGQSALAVGISHVSGNGRWSTNLMGTTSSQNDTGMAMGVGYQW
ncbi:YadA-like family protein [Pseudomonas protegens]|uniref:YadA-like family protein n=1 Tax=Pseudomonas protegens TaxID=380021 RepID=UPI0037F37399